MKRQNGRHLLGNLAVLVLIAAPCSDQPCYNGICVITKTPPFYRCSCTLGVGGSRCTESMPTFAVKLKRYLILQLFKKK